MSTLEELDALSSRELHDRAIRHALHHVDIEFLWELLRAVPAAEAAEGHIAHADMDISKVSGLLSDAVTSGGTDVTDALRPLYIDYLLKQLFSPGDDPPVTPRLGGCHPPRPPWPGAKEAFASLGSSLALAGPRIARLAVCRDCAAPGG